jgi:hypothetical protein
MDNNSINGTNDKINNSDFGAGQAASRQTRLEVIRAAQQALILTKKI